MRLNFMTCMPIHYISAYKDDANFLCESSIEESRKIGYSTGHWKRTKAPFMYQICTFQEGLTDVKSAATP